MTKVMLEGKTWYLLPEEEFENISILAREDTKRMNRKDIAKMLGISYQRLSECPWLLPYNGKGMRGKRNATWTEREVLAWLKKSRERLKEEYEDACTGH